MMEETPALTLCCVLQKGGTFDNPPGYSCPLTTARSVVVTLGFLPRSDPAMRVFQRVNYGIVS